MSLRSHPIVIFLDRSGFLLYQDLLASIWQFPFSEDLVLHLEVINKEQLINVIWSSIQKNKMVPSSLVVVLSDSLLFHKDLAPQNQGQTPQAVEAEELKIQQFLENVPFEEPMAKVIGRSMLIATNKDLLEAITLPFKKLGCTLESVVPIFVYENKIDFSKGVTAETAKGVLKNQDLLKAANMLVGQERVEVKKEQIETTEQQDTISEKPKNKRQTVLIIAFILLLVVVGIVYFISRNSEEALAPSSTSGSPAPPQTSALIDSTPNPTIVAQPTEPIVASPSARESLNAIEATVVVNTETQAIGQILKKRLEETGVESVTVSVSDATNPARSSVLLASGIDSNTRRVIADEVRKILSDASVQESQTLEDLTISIVVGSAL